MQTPKANEVLQKEVFTFISNKNNSFKIEIQNRFTTLAVNATFIGNNYSKEYMKISTLEDLKNDKYLSLLDSIKEIYDEIINIINQKKDEVKIVEDNNELFLHLPLGGLKIKEIILCLNEEIKNEKEHIQDLHEIISNLKQENTELKNNQKKLEDKIKYLESLINDINTWKKYKKEYENISGLESLVLGENEKYNMTIKNWINPKSKIKAELLYRLSRDGKEYKTFHDLCDNKGNTLTIFKLEDGNILGGYTTKDWDNCKKWKQDENTFVFSLNEDVKCIPNRHNDYNAIYCNQFYGPYFGPISFYNSKMDEVFIHHTHSYYIEAQRLYPGKNYGDYKCQEVEVYKIMIN